MARFGSLHRCALLLALAAFLPACGMVDDDPAPTASGGGAPAPSSPPPPASPPPGSPPPSSPPPTSPPPPSSPPPTSPPPAGAPSSPGLAGPSAFASVTQGVAPLGVVFSAVKSSVNGSGQAIVQPSDGDYASFQYDWDYGDPGSGVWPTSLRSRNGDSGYIGAHVYEQPGTYTCALTIVDAGGNTHRYAQQITVSAWPGTTYYVSDAGNDANSGLSESTPWRSIAKVMQNLGTNRRFLFRRGAIFTSSQFLSVHSPGPGLLGAYGPSSSPRPVLQLSGDSAFMFYQDDWRMVDLDIRGPQQSGRMGVSFSADGGIDRILLLRLAVRDFDTGIGWSNLTNAPPNDGVVVAECSGTSGAVNGMYVGGRRLALLGNTITDPGISHVTRVWQANRSVIAHNAFLNPGGDRHSLKLHGPPPTESTPPTDYVVVSSNRFQGQLWPVIVAPQNTVSNEPVSNVLIERNRSLSTAQTSVHYIVEARDVTIRNNIMDGTLGTSRFTGVTVQNGGVVQDPGRIRIENNTMYRGSSGVEARMVSVQSGAFEVLVRNNLGSFPAVAASAKSVIQGGSTGLVVENNLLTDAPGFVNPGAGDFHLLPSSPALNSGIPSVRVKDDYNGIPRPQGSAPDRGAFEQ